MEYKRTQVCWSNLTQPSMHYVYVVRDKNKKSLYIGYSNNLERRMKQHQLTSNVELIYSEIYLSERDARTRERKLKLYGSAWRGLKQRLKDSLK